MRIHFLYGSKPLKKYKATEFHWFGGLHGGHVSLEIDDVDYSFVPANDLHVFPHKKSLSAIYSGGETRGKPMTVPTCKYAWVEIPLSGTQYNKALEIVTKYCDKTPYDYAFFGMRCAASADDVLAQIGIFSKRKNIGYIVRSFYPKLLRRKVFALAKEKKYKVIRQEGKPTRKWEKD